VYTKGSRDRENAVASGFGGVLDAKIHMLSWLIKSPIGGISRDFSLEAAAVRR
jgi:hypothetical protein